MTVLSTRWPKYWSFSFSISPSNEYSGLISFKMDWLDLLAVQGTLKSLLQHHSSKASILWHSAFSVVQISHLYMTTGKTVALTRWTFVSKVMSLLFNKLLRLVITFLPRSKHLLILWLQSPSSVILEAKKIKSGTVPLFPRLFVMAFCMMYSAYNLNKQGDNTQSWCSPVLIWNQSVVSCPVLTVASWPAYRFFRKQVRWVWYSHVLKNFPQFVVSDTVKVYWVVNKAEVNVFSGTLLLFPWSSGCWQFDLWFLCLF